jgi:uncharacterized membrane protein
MNNKQYQIVRIIIGVVVGAIVATASTTNNFYLAITGVLIGMLFMFLAKSKFKEVVVDERVMIVSGRASRAAYVIVTMFLAIAGLFFIFSAKKNGDVYGESIGVLLSYVTMLLIAVYSVSYHYYNKKYGGN